MASLFRRAARMVSSATRGARCALSSSSRVASFSSAAVASATKPPSGPASSIGTARVRKMKPTSPGMRHQVRLDRSHLWKGKPYRPLTQALRRKGGRNNQGRITVRHRGGGSKRRWRVMDFKREVRDSPGIVERIEYDPCRTAEIALVKYPVLEEQGVESFRYMIAPQGLAPGDEIVASVDEETKIKTGNCIPLANVPLGTSVCCVELYPGKGAQLGRSAGTYLTMLDKQMKKGHALVRQQSGEKRFIPLDCMATIGAVSNPLHKAQKLGKAGRTRHRGRRPRVRGVAMNPVDHPMGGGEGKSSGGRPSCSPTGVLAKGFKTRKKNKPMPLVFETRRAAQLKARR